MNHLHAGGVQSNERCQGSIAQGGQSRHGAKVLMFAQEQLQLNGLHILGMKDS